MIDDVRTFYDKNAEIEWGRLGAGLGKIEFASTLRLIEKYFPPSGRVCDTASGPGRYALELSRRGYEVALHDLSDKQLAVARRAFAAEGLQSCGFVQGDARHLTSLRNESFGAALHLGPCYHLISAADRVQSLRELQRILLPGAPAIVAYLNSWGLMRTGITDFPQRFRDIEELRSMLGARSFETMAGFTACHWATPASARAEIQEANLEVVTYVGAEGFVGGMTAHVERLAETDRLAYENVLRVVAESSELPQFRDATDHLHFVVRKPPRKAEPPNAGDGRTST